MSLLFCFFAPGLVIVLLLIPINGRITDLMRKAQADQLTLKDQRLRIVNEILNGIKVRFLPQFLCKLSAYFVLRLNFMFQFRCIVENTS